MRLTQDEMTAAIKEAQGILTPYRAQQTIDLDDELAGVSIIIEHESGRNPFAINDWDSNAVKFTPSIGLMQVIEPTFQKHALNTFENIWKPVDNILAGMRYAINRYGSIAQVPGVVKVRAGGQYVGY